MIIFHSNIQTYIYIYIYIYIFICLSLDRLIIFNHTHDYILSIYIYIPYRLIGSVGRVFANGPGDQGSIPGRIIPKTLKMVLSTSLFNTQ